MKYKDMEDGELEFKHEFEAEPGEYQYKFRLGPGDWWVLDETKPTVDDGTGIRNNLLVVEPKPQQPKLAKAREAEVEQPSQEKVIPASIQVADTQEKHAEPVDDMNDDDDIPESEKNLFRHETVQVPDATGESDHEDEGIEGDDEEIEEPPLFEHEAGPFQRVDSQFGTPSKTNNFEFDNSPNHQLRLTTSPSMSAMLFALSSGMKLVPRTTWTLMRRRCLLTRACLRSCLQALFRLHLASSASLIFKTSMILHSSHSLSTRLAFKLVFSVSRHAIKQMKLCSRELLLRLPWLRQSLSRPRPVLIQCTMSSTI